jgi:hypothetical protein
MLVLLAVALWVVATGRDSVLTPTCPESSMLSPLLGIKKLVSSPTSRYDIK